MNINSKHIEELGGLVSLKMELNTPDLPEFDEKEVTAYLFDAFGVARCEDKYLFLKYPGLGNAKMDEQIRRTINRDRYGYRLPDKFKITVDDLAICFAEVEEITLNEYVNQLMKGMVTYSPTRMLPRRLSGERLREQTMRIIMNPPKHLYIFKDDSEFLKELDGKIYAISDLNGNVICDVLEEDMTALEDQDIISDGQTVYAGSIDYIRSQRVEVIFLNK
jgi:hypothetical protein|nr:MAG TPA: hypothetical protein [Caudoviricetes sp.]